jgi:hypothetical protein
VNAGAPRAVYRAVATPGHQMWNVTLPTFPTLANVARSIDLVQDAAIESIIKSELDWEPGFDVAVEMANPYKPIPGTPKAVVVDIDGTLAHHNSRGPFDFDKVETDDLDENVATYLNLMYAGFNEVILLSGRQSEFRPHTERWLKKHHVGYTELWMRAEDDRRSDCLVKAELFDSHIRDRFTVTHVLDDRNRVVYLWRKLGLPCWQVAPGDF